MSDIWDIKNILNDRELNLHIINFSFIIAQNKKWLFQTQFKNSEGLIYHRNSFYRKWLIDYKGTLKGIHLRKHEMKATNITRKLHYTNHHDVHITWVNIEVYTKMRSLRVMTLFTLKDIKNIMEVWGIYLSGHFETFTVGNYDSQEVLLPLFNDTWLIVIYNGHDEILNTLDYTVSTRFNIINS